MSFLAYPKIKRLGDVDLRITQKIHGSNAQILIHEDGSISTYSRSREITPTNDNYGFASFIQKNSSLFLSKLGPGRYYGEWAGPGINSGEGLTERTLVLFNYWNDYSENGLPPNTVQVPVLFGETVNLNEVHRIICEQLHILTMQGSRLVPGYMGSEGIVVEIDGHKYKHVLQSESKPVSKTREGYIHRDTKTDYSYLCQPIRLQKLLTRDERYTKVENIRDTVTAYLDDLVEEGEMLDSMRKLTSRIIFQYIREAISEQSTPNNHRGDDTNSND